MGCPSWIVACVGFSVGGLGVGILCAGFLARDKLFDIYDGGISISGVNSNVFVPSLWGFVANCCLLFLICVMP